MDIRKPVLAIVSGGSPCPGTNAVICSVAIEALNSECDVIGIVDGFKYLMQGISTNVIELVMKDVSSIQHLAGSILRTSKSQIKTPEEADNALRVLQLLRADYVVAIGGTESAHSAYLVSMAAQRIGYPLQVVCVPKTIFNDLPLPDNAPTFGFSTARDYGMQLVNNLRVDAKTLNRYFVVTVMGQRAGHLAIGIGKSAAATLTLIPEEYEQGFRFEVLVKTVAALVIKRSLMKRMYGMIVLCEGLVNKMDSSDVTRLFGTVDKGHDLIARVLAEHVLEYILVPFIITNFSFRLLSEYKIRTKFLHRYIGSELRSAAPNSADLELARDLGYAACRYVLSGGNNALITLKAGNVHPMNFDEIIDCGTGMSQIRNVDLQSNSYVVARNYQIRLKKDDLRNSTFLFILEDRFGIKAEEFAERFQCIAE